MMTEQLAQPQSMHRRAQREPIRTLFGPGMEARKPLSGHTGVLLTTRRNGLFRRAATGEYVVQKKTIRGTAQSGCETGVLQAYDTSKAPTSGGRCPPPPRSF